MADKQIGDLTASSVIGSADVMHVAIGGNSRKVTAADAAESFRELAFTGAKVRKSANLTAQNLTGTVAVTWNIEDYDVDGYHDAGSNTERLTCAEAGYYEFKGLLDLANVGTGNYCRLLIERFNSAGSLQEYVAIQMMEASVTGSFHINAAGECHMSVGDYCVLYAHVESDTSVDITTLSYFSVRRVG